VKHKATPLVLLGLEVVSASHTHKVKYIDLLTLVKSRIGAKAFHELSWTYAEKERAQAKRELPDFLNFDQGLISDESSSEAHQSKHLVQMILTDFASDNLSKEKLNQLFTVFTPFLEYTEAATGQTLLMKLVKSNNSHVVFNFLMGSQFDEEKKDFVLAQKSRPRVNLNTQDKLGRTALHYAIQPCDKYAGKGFLQDTRTVSALIARGASATIKDRKGVSALDLAKKCKALVELFNKNAERPIAFVKPQKTVFDAAVDRAYTADADKYLAAQMDRIKASQMAVDSKNKPECAVDDHEDLKNCEVVQSDVVGVDGVSKLYFDTVMIKVDVKASYYGLNAFYVIQLLHDKAKDLFILWTRWGRIGDFGQYQRTPFPSLLAAQMEFTKVFRQKSGNKWEDVVSFNALPKRYKLRRLSGKNVYLTPDMRKWQAYEAEVDMNKVLMNFAEHSNLRKSTLTKPEFEFIKPLVDSAYILRRLKKQQFSDNLVFEGLLDRNVLQSLYKILVKMLDLIATKEKARKDADFQAFAAAKTELFDLTNQYYELSTPTEFAFDGIKDLDDESSVVSQFKKLQRLRDLEHASQLLMAAAQNV